MKLIKCTDTTNSVDAYAKSKTKSTTYHTFQPHWHASRQRRDCLNILPMLNSPSRRFDWQTARRESTTHISFTLVFCDLPCALDADMLATPRILRKYQTTYNAAKNTLCLSASLLLKDSSTVTLLFESCNQRLIYIRAIVEEKKHIVRDRNNGQGRRRKPSHLFHGLSILQVGATKVPVTSMHEVTEVHLCDVASHNSCVSRPPESVAVFFRQPEQAWVSVGVILGRACFAILLTISHKTLQRRIRK